MALTFSIIIPVYNVEPFLRCCLDSVLSQTYNNWEAICVNDGSTDGSAALLDEYAAKDSRLRIVTQPNGGLSSARNAGLREAKGENILFLDSDDWLEPEALQTLSQHLESVDLLCFSGRRFFEETGAFGVADKLVEKTYESGMDYYNENALMHRDFAFVSVVLRAYKRTLLVDHGLWFKEGVYHEDNLFTPQACFYAQKVKVLNACLYDYRVRAHSIMTTTDAKRARDLMEIANELADFFLPKEGFDKTVVYRSITHHYQVAFLNVPVERKNEMKVLCNWKNYKKVSRTKLRHRWNYLKNGGCFKK